MLDTFDMQQGGSQYRRLVSAFQRVFGATIFFGTDARRLKATVFHQNRLSQNTITLSSEFYEEITSHPIPTDLEPAKVLSCAPAALDLFTWLSYRCYTAKGPEQVPLFGEAGLAQQLGSVEYARPRKFREKLERRLDLVRTLWPQCPARITPDGLGLIVDQAFAIVPSYGGENARI